MKKRVVVIGVDAADIELIHHFVSKGLLKNFEKVMKGGVSGPLRSTIPPFTAPAWPSFFTGVYSDKHRIHDFVKEKKDHGGTRLCTLKDSKVPPLWDLLSNYRSCVMNLPMSFPAPKINGYFISGFPFTADKRKAFYPSSLLEEIEKNCGKYPFHEHEGIHGEGMEQLNIYSFDHLLQAMEKRKEIFLHVLEEKECDIYIVQFQNPDKIQHNFWCFWDDRYIGYEKNNTLNNSIERLYMKIDDIVGQILRHIDEETILFIVSDHGFGLLELIPSFNKWLSENGFLKSKEEKTSRLDKSTMLKLSTTLRLHQLVKLLPRTIIKRLKKFSTARTTLSYDSIDWSRTQAYSVGFPSYIYINKEVIKDDTSEYREIRNEIIEKLSEEESIKEIFSKEELYSIQNPALPDLIVTVKEHGISEKRKNLIAQPGHRQHGVFFAYGKEIVEGREVTAEIVDIVPTILHIFDVPIPLYIDGRVRMEIFKGDSIFATKAIQYRKKSEKEKLKEMIDGLKEREEI